MEFMITFNHTEGVWDRLSAEERASHDVWLRSFIAELEEQKHAKLVFLAPPDQRKTVHKLEGEDVEVTDGPSVAGPEQMGGYYIIEAESVDEAVAWARKGRWLVGSNEVCQRFSLPD